MCAVATAACLIAFVALSLASCGSEEAAEERPPLALSARTGGRRCPGTVAVRRPWNVRTHRRRTLSRPRGCPSRPEVSKCASSRSAASPSPAQRSPIAGGPSAPTLTGGSWSGPSTGGTARPRRAAANARPRSRTCPSRRRLKAWSGRTARVSPPRRGGLLADVRQIGSWNSLLGAPTAVPPGSSGRAAA